MPAASSLLPWFAPRLSRPMIGVLNNLGHEMHYTRGEVLYESPGFFRPLMLVRRGIVARALMDPLHADPLLVSLSGPRALCGSCETLYVQDRMVRRHWCMTSVDVHVVNAAYYFASAIKIHFGSVSSAIILRFVLSAIA